MKIYESPAIKSMNSIRVAQSGSFATTKEDTKYDRDDIIVELKVILAKVERDIKKHCKSNKHKHS
jgi:hypothetical protein